MRIHGCPGFIAVFAFERLNDICMLDERAAMAIEHGGIPFRDAGIPDEMMRHENIHDAFILLNQRQNIKMLQKCFVKNQVVKPKLADAVRLIVLQQTMLLLQRFFHTGDRHNRMITRIICRDDPGAIVFDHQTDMICLIDVGLAWRMKRETAIGQNINVSFMRQFVQSVTHRRSGDGYLCSQLRFAVNLSKFKFAVIDHIPQMVIRDIVQRFVFRHPNTPLFVPYEIDCILS